MISIRQIILGIAGFVAAWIFLTAPVAGQTTGKIIGRVVDQESGDPLLGVNVLIENTTRGAATDANGDFFILNVPPGVYSLRIQMIGYAVFRIEEVRVSVNRTTEVGVIRMKPEAIQTKAIVVKAEKVTIKKDQTSSVRNVSAEDLEVLPVEDLNAVVDMQPGVVKGHFRGGRSNEVAYLVDGIQVTEVFGGEGKTVDLEPEAIQDLEVITGTFNAEYGQAMSGVINVVTKDGGNQFHGMVEGLLANYVTSHDDIFIGLKESEIFRNQDYKVQLSGPIWKNKLTFFTNFRYQNNKNHLNGIRRFRVDDYSFFLADDPSQWYSEHTGDSSYVPMNSSENLSFMGKLTMKPFTNFKLSLLYTRNQDVWNNYIHVYKYNPDGRPSAHRKTDMVSLQINHLLSPKLFYELKLSYQDNYNGYYVYKNPFDPRYVHDAYHNIEGPGFFTGGQDKTHSERFLKQNMLDFDVTLQATKHHNLKAGFTGTLYDLDNHWSQIRNKYAGMEEEGISYFDPERNKMVFPYYEPVIYPDSSIYSDIYRVKPREFAVYVQDKMEFDEMVINFGVRYDYFDPNTVYPSQPRNPANQLLFENNPEKMSTYPKADPKFQVSPRLGLSYQLGSAALLRFSYGHFFQMPPMYAIYQNHSFQVAPTDYSTTMGNAQIKAQKTVQYEVGLWQELMKGMGLEVALFYRDIYDLLSAKVISTFNQIEYGLYSNKDYGNAKGLEVKYDFVWNHISVYANYTLQYTRGNADNPTQTFDRAGNSRDPINRLIPMSWDQRHTLNVTMGYNTPQYGVTLTGYYNSGTPFTWSPIAESMLSRVNLYPNNNWMPAQYWADLNSYLNLRLTNRLKLQLRLSIYNLFDRLNEVAVNPQTGRAYTAIIREVDLLGHRSDFNEYIDRVHNPSMFSAPRMVKFGLGIVF